MSGSARWMLAFGVSLSLACSQAHSGGRTGDGGADGEVDAARDAGREGGSESFDRPCAEPSECTLVSNTCCGTCGRPSLADVDAVRVDAVEAYGRAVCPDPDPICPGCATMPNPNLLATCDRTTARCEVMDIEQDEVSACERDTDCVVRVPDCCPCGADVSVPRLVALRVDRVRDYLARVCDSAIACPECEPVYPADVEAICDRASGHCRIQQGVPGP